VQGVSGPADERFGLVLVVCAAAAWSTAGYFARLVHVDVWTMVFWRNTFGGSAILVFFIVQQRSRAPSQLASLGRLGWAAGLVNGLSMIAFVAALRTTLVANVVIIYATAPFIAAGLAWIWYRHAATRRTLLASLVALVGIAITVGGTPGIGSLGGDGLAVLMTIGLAAYTVLLRRRPDIPSAAAATASAWIGALIALPFASPGAVSARDLGELALFGIASFALGLVLYTIGSRHLHPARTALVSTLDTPLAPLWVWLAFSQVPTVASVVGGVIVMLAVIGNVLAERPARLIAAELDSTL
jgi:drug/metabolite transporter (DMT)-like permease